MTTEYHCSLGHFYYRKKGQQEWTYIDNKEVVRRLEKYDELKKKKKK